MPTFLFSYTHVCTNIYVVLEQYVSSIFRYIFLNIKIGSKCSKYGCMFTTWLLLRGYDSSGKHRSSGIYTHMPAHMPTHARTHTHTRVNLFVVIYALYICVIIGQRKCLTLLLTCWGTNSSLNRLQRVVSRSTR